MSFRTSIPATAEWFHDRHVELDKLEAVLRRLRAGAPSWLLVVGPRKVGRTSLLMELARRSPRRSLAFVVLDVLESLPVSFDVFRAYALRVLDALLGPEVGLSFGALSRRPAEFRAALQGSPSFARLPADTRAELTELPDRKADGAFVRACLDLPERLAEVRNKRVLVAIDEFQELATLSPARGGADPLPLMRSVWQRHQRVSYVVSGSARRTLIDLVTSEHSPFFQHFALLEVGPFSREDAVELLVSRSRDERPIPRPIAEQAFDAVGGHPFYLQLIGEALIARPGAVGGAALKAALQDVLFSRTGRLSLYFENEFARLVGRSTGLSAALEALSEGPMRLSELAAAIKAPSGATVQYVERLADAVVRREDGRYALSDATFGHWLRWRQPGGTVVPMTLIGDEAERRVTEHLARMGFELVYQSRASRGAFDLLATRGPHQLAVQVKRSALPLRFTRGEWSRMEADAKRYRWRWVLAAHLPDGAVAILDPAGAKRGAQVRVGRAAEIENLLTWVEGGDP